MIGARTLREIVDQPEVWAAAIRSFGAAAPEIARLFRERDPDEVIFTGCGSSYYLSMTAAASMQSVAGLRARAVPASEILQFPGSVFVPGSRPLLVASSRSGITTETVRAVEVARRRGIPTLSLTCAHRSPLVRQADVSVHSPKGREESVVMTKSFSSLLLLGLLLAADRAGSSALRAELRRLTTLGRRVIKVALTLCADLGAGASRFVFLGAGPAHGIAWEAMLKMTEMAQRPAVAYHPLEFRHGPIAAVGPGTVAVLFGSRAGARLEADLARDLRRSGATVVSLLDDWRGNADVDVNVALGVRLSDEARCLLYVPFAQALAYHRAIGAGLDPDYPRGLTYA
ncbi:MAG: SIS domain-containing protein, partial [candidate division NC10 bacterium]|nr:SIS domain-containing protein [candidate division NC10 bacterium]